MSIDEQDKLLASAREFKSNDYVKGTAQFTDMTNAELLLAEYGENIRFCTPWNKWLVWDGRRWAIDDNTYVDELVKRMIRKLYVIASSVSDLRLRLDLESHIKKWKPCADGVQCENRHSLKKRLRFCRICLIPIRGCLMCRTVRLT